MALWRFSSTLVTKAVKVPAKLCSGLLKTQSQWLLNRPKLKNILPFDAESRLLLLKEDLETVPESLSQWEVIEHTLNLGYDHLTTSETLRALLPPEVSVPTGFETVGQVAHFNLRDEHMPYRHLIGQVVLEKSHVRTVVTKLNSITSTFRTFEMEVIAGDPCTTVTVKEGACLFEFDFAKVYWSSKLQRERDIVLQELLPGQVVCDMFAGVGPLALRAAKQGCYVIANDLNPEGAAGLVLNAKKNKVTERVACYNLDARDFVRQLVCTPREEGPLEGPSPPISRLPANFHHVYMNLPKDAIEFLDVFLGLFTASAWPELPTIHVYAFSASSDPKSEFLDRIRGVWGQLEIPDFQIRKVRDISPRKYVYCLTFPLPREVAFGLSKRPGEAIDCGVSKRLHS